MTKDNINKTNSKGDIVSNSLKQSKSNLNAQQSLKRMKPMPRNFDINDDIEINIHLEETPPKMIEQVSTPATHKARLSGTLYINDPASTKNK